MTSNRAASLRVMTVVSRSPEPPPYTADIFLPGAMHGAIVHSTIKQTGEPSSIDTAAAERAPGVVAVFTHRNMPRMKPTPMTVEPPTSPWSVLSSPSG